MHKTIDYIIKACYNIVSIDTEVYNGEYDRNFSNRERRRG